MLSITRGMTMIDTTGDPAMPAALRKQTAVVMVERDIFRNVYTFQCSVEVLPELMAMMERGAELWRADGVDLAVEFELVTQEPKYMSLKEHLAALAPDGPDQGGA